MISAGLILAGSAPGAMASNVMCYIAKADTAYSVSLTTVSTLLCPVLTPALTLFLAGKKVPIAFTAMMQTALLTVVVPLLAGFAVRCLLKKRIEKVLIIFPAISVTFIIFICSLVIAMNKQHLLAVSAAVIASAVILNVYGMAAGYGTGMLFSMDKMKKRTLCIEIGMQNAGLGTVLAAKHLGPKATLPTAAFVFICIITASLMVAFWQKKPQQQPTITS